MAHDTVQFDLSMLTDDLEDAWEFEAERLLSDAPPLNIMEAVSKLEGYHSSFLFLWMAPKEDDKTSLQLQVEKTDLAYVDSEDVRLFGVLECMNKRQVTFAHIHGRALRPVTREEDSDSDDKRQRELTLLQTRCVLGDVSEKTDCIAEAVASLKKYSLL